MKYISAKEIAEKWGVSLRSIQNYCSTGRIPGAQNLGKQWIIPADAVRPSDSRFKTSPSNAGAYKFPLFIYSPSYTYSDSFDHYEHTLFSAQLKLLEGSYVESIGLCREVLDMEAPLHVIIGCYYTIGLCAIPLGNHHEYKKVLTQIETAINPDNLHFEDYKLILYSIKRYIGWNHRLFDNIDANKLSADALYFYQYECLLSVALSSEKLPMDVIHFYDAFALQVSSEGVEPLDSNLRFALAALHISSAGPSAEEHVYTACSIALSHNWINIIAKNHSLEKSLIKNCLDKIVPGYSMKVFEIADRDFNKWRFVNKQESGFYPFTAFDPNVISLLFMISQGLSNSEICTIMDLSPIELRNILMDCYKIANVKNRNELKKHVISQMSTWF